MRPLLMLIGNGDPPQLSREFTTGEEGQTSDLKESNWSYNTLEMFSDALSDNSFVNMDLEAFGDFSELSFNPPQFPDYTDKMDNLLHISRPQTPAFEGSFLDPSSAWPLDTLEANICSPPALVLAPQSPQCILTGTINKQHQQWSATQCIRKLSELSISLFEHGKTIPPLSIHDPVPENEKHLEKTKYEAQGFGSYSVDETFLLTQGLIDIYPLFIDMFARRKTFHPNMSNVQRSSRCQQITTDQRVEQFGPVASSLSSPLDLDHSSILLVLSCHSRLIDIYDQLFKHMKICLEDICIQSTVQQHSYKAPQLRIGNYVPPAATAVPMQLLMLLHFATSLCTYAIELDEHVQERGNGHPSAGRNISGTDEEGMRALSGNSSRKIRERASAMLQHVNSLKGLILKGNLMS